MQVQKVFTLAFISQRDTYKMHRFIQNHKNNLSVSFVIFMPWYGSCGRHGVLRENKPKAEWAIDSGHEGDRNNCFSKIQLVGQKYWE